ncbi:MAG: ISL3 family transposase [Planctomycetaceae bacterium]|nr:ISL3 family transposase [Planctomycetaceae bacterium]
MNDLNQHYALLLGLREEWLVQSVDLDLEAQRVEIHLQDNPDSKCGCPECGLPSPLKDHSEERTWRHLDTMQFETVIKARIPRTNCPEHGVHNVHIPWASPHGRFTLLFEAFAIRVLKASSSIDRGRRLLRLGWEAAQRIMSDAVERGLERRDLEEIKHIGIDEKNFGKGHDYVSVMTDIDGGRVLEVTPGRTKEAADSLWKTLPEEQKSQVKAVAVDMWAAFIHSAEENVPEADIVHDRFHIAKHLNEAVDKVRRAEHKSLKQEGDERLTGSRYLWLTNEENLSDDQATTFEDLKESTLKTSRAWALRELFREFWEQPGAYTGRLFFESWNAWASRCRLKPMVKVAKMIKRHLDRIVTWFAHRITNASSEGFNSLIQALKSAARGFRNFENYRTRILFFCGQLNLFPESIAQTTHEVP